jgi:hypothetical protein
MNIDKVTTKLHKRGASTNIAKLVKYMHIDTHDMMKLLKKRIEYDEQDG